MIITKPENITLNNFNFKYEQPKNILTCASYTMNIDLKQKQQIYSENTEYLRMFENIFFELFGLDKIKRVSNQSREISTDGINEILRYEFSTKGENIRLNSTIDINHTLISNQITRLINNNAEQPITSKIILWHDDLDSTRIEKLYRKITSLGINITQSAQRDISKLEMLLSNSGTMDDYCKLLQISNIIAKSNS